METETHRRPQTSKEKEEFSSGGKRHLLILRGPWGLAIDKAINWTTGWSMVTWQYANAHGMEYTPTLMLWTIGARSGRTRSAVLPWFRYGDAMVLRGSNGGGPTDPNWVHNIRANEQAWVRVDRKTRAVRAHVAEGEEWQQIYDELCKLGPSTAAYQKMCAPRQLPLVVLRESPA